MTAVVDRPAPRPPLDPRLRARRIEVARSAGRKRLRRLLVGLALVAVTGLSVVMIDSRALDVDHVRVIGVGRTSERAVERATAIERGEAMTWLDLGGARRRVEALPWIDTVSLERRWPGTVAVTVTERAPVAGQILSEVPLEVALLDASGRVLEVTNDPRAGVAVLKGLPKPPKPGRRVARAGRGALAVVDALPARLRPRVAAIEHDKGEYRILLDGRLQVRLGDADRLDEKVLSLLTMLDQVSLERVTSIDVRVPDTPVVRRTPLPQPKPKATTKPTVRTTPRPTGTSPSLTKPSTST